MLGSWVMLVRCTGYCTASCNCCFKDVTSPVCVQSQSSWLSHLGLPAALRVIHPCVWWLQCSGAVSPALPVLPDGHNALFWGLSFLESALWVPLLWEGSWSVLCLSTFLGRLSPHPVALLPAVPWADGTSQKPDILGATRNWDRIYVQLRLIEVKDRQCNLGLNMTQSD